MSTFDIAKAAHAEGLNPNGAYQYEWADAPVRKLRELGLIAKDGPKPRYERQRYTLTYEGQKIFSAASLPQNLPKSSVTTA